MAKAKTIFKTIITEGSFYDIKPPEYELFTIDLKEKKAQKINEKTQEVLSQERCFEIIIDVGKLPKHYIGQLSSDLKVAFGLNFAPFNYKLNQYNYYTSTYVDKEKQIEKLKDIFEALTDFENLYNKNKEKIEPSFNKAVLEIKDFVTEEFDVKFNETLNTFIVIAKSYLGGDIYRNLSNASKETGYIQNNKVVSDFFGNKNYTKNAYFILDKAAFITVEPFLREKSDNQKKFLEKQINIYEANKELFHSLVYEEDNLFNFKVKLNIEKGCFEFFCKGYRVSSFEGKSSSRGLLDLWALNCLLSDTEENLEGDINCVEANSYEIENMSYYKENLKELKDSSLKNKTYFVPFEEVKKIQRISEKFHKENKLWSSAEIEIKKNTNMFTKENSFGNLYKYPAIFFDGAGKSYLIYKYRDVKNKKSDTKTTALKGFEIDKQTYDYLTQKHIFADNILKNTKFLNVQLWAGYNVAINHNESEQVFNNVLMAHEIGSQPKEKVNKKKMKI